MSETVRGYVRKINTKQGVGKRGPWTLYSVKLTNADGSVELDPWYSAGFRPLPYAEGDYIEATIKPGQKDGYFDLTDGKKVDAPKPAASSAASGVKQSSAPPTNKDISIAYQAARNAAIELTKLQIEKGGLPLPKKAPDIYAVIRAAVDKETVQFFHDVGTLRLLETVADGGALEESPGEATAESEDDE